MEFRKPYVRGLYYNHNNDSWCYESEICYDCPKPICVLSFETELPAQLFGVTLPNEIWKE